MTHGRSPAERIASSARSAPSPSPQGPPSSPPSPATPPPPFSPPAACLQRGSFDNPSSLLTVTYDNGRYAFEGSEAEQSVGEGEYHFFSISHFNPLRVFDASPTQQCTASYQCNNGAQHYSASLRAAFCTGGLEFTVSEVVPGGCVGHSFTVQNKNDEAGAEVRFHFSPTCTAPPPSPPPPSPPPPIIFVALSGDAAAAALTQQAEDQTFYHIEFTGNTVAAGDWVCWVSGTLSNTNP